MQDEYFKRWDKFCKADKEPISIKALSKNNSPAVEPGQIYKIMRDQQSIEILQQFHPKVRTDFQAFIEECENCFGITLRLMSVYRDMAEQAKIYAVGRTTKGENATPEKPMGDIISDAKPGSSWHNFGLAADLGIVLANGSISYNFDYMKFANIGQQWGISWGGNFPHFKDLDHFEEQSGQTLTHLLGLYNAAKFIPDTHFVDF